MKYLISVAFIIASIFGGFAYFGQSNGVGGGLGTIEQLGLWFFDGTNITQNTSGTPVKLTGYESSGDCLVTNASGVLATSSCGGGGSSKWTDGGSFIFPTAGESVSGSFFSGTSTTATSTFVTASSTRFCLGSDCRTTWPTGTVTSVAQTVPTGFTITGSPVTTTGTLAIAYDTGYGAILTASTTEWATAYASTTALTPSYIRGLFSNTATGLTYTAGTGATSLTSGYDIPLSASTTQWSGFYNTPSSRITAGNYLSWSTNTLNASVQISTSSSNGALAFWTGSSALGSVATGTLTETVTGLELSATRGLVGGAAILALTSGYGIPLTASTTEWTNFYNTPSGRITAGTGIDWSGNTLNGVYTAGDALTLTGEDFDFDGGATPSGDLGGTWASPSVTDDSHAHTGATLSGIDISSDTNLSADGVEIILTGDALSLGTELSFTNATSTASFFSALGTFTNTVVNTLLTAAAATFTGLVDIGAGVLEIPNGAAPTVDSIGELAIDTTGDQLLVGDTSGNARVVQIEDVKIWSVTIASTSDAFLSSGLVPVPTQLDGYTISRIQCHVSGGTSKVIAVEDASANSSEDITCATTNTTDDGSITNATYTANELSYIDFGATSGTVNYVTISVFGVWTRE